MIRTTFPLAATETTTMRPAARLHGEHTRAARRAVSTADALTPQPSLAFRLAYIG